MTYEPAPKHVARSRTVVINAVVAAVALNEILALANEHATALHIPHEWVARISFLGAVLTILLRRFTWTRPVRFRRRRRMRRDEWDAAKSDEVQMELPEQMFV